MNDWAKSESELVAQVQQLRERVALLEKSEEQHKQTEQVLRLTNSYNRSLIEASLDAFITVSLNGLITDVNAATESITGFSRLELIGSELRHYFKEPAKIEAGYRRLLEGMPLRNYPMDIRHKWGGVVPVLCNATTFRGEAGEVKWWIIAARDISEIKRSEVKLRENEIRFHAIADSSNNWEYWHEANGALGYVSPACQRISGYPPDAFIRTPALLEKIVHPEDRQLFIRHNQTPRDSTTEPPLEFRIIAKTGEVRWLLHRCQPVFDENAQFVGRRATNQDITTRKNLEIEHERAEARLKQLTQQLMTVQEAERRRISQDLHDDIGQGMTALILRLNALLNGLDPAQEAARRELAEAIGSVELLMNQIRQLAYQLRPPALDSMPLSKAVAALCSSFVQKSGLAVHYSSDTELPPIPNVQGTALYRLVQEGLNNAVKHARANSVWVSLDYADGEVCLSLEDDGQGFNLHEVQVGMGLQGLCDRFLMLNGILDIESTPGNGTRLYGALPLANHNL